MEGSTGEHGEHEVTGLLRRMGGGDAGAERALLDLVYGELRRLAQRSMHGERANHTLQPTALVHEVWIRLAGARADWEDRAHFLRVAARAMRRVLVDHARAREAQKRGRRAELPEQALDLERLIGVYEERAIDVLALHEALERLAGFDAPLARMVELRYFAGLSIDETAEALGQSPATIDRSWRLARAWLRTELGGEAGERG